MKHLTATTKNILAEIYDQLGGRPPDEKERSIQDIPKTVTPKTSKFYSFENWWGEVKFSIGTMSQSQIRAIRSDLNNASCYGQFDEEVKYLNSFLD